MKIRIGDISLFVEVVGCKLASDNRRTVEKPTVVFLHGGPAWDHQTLLGDFKGLQECAQLIFYDHRGLGRSDPSTKGAWTLRQWADDLKGLIEALGLERPIICGQSFGGIVAQQFAVDYVGMYSGLILSATAAWFDFDSVLANFRVLGGERLEAMARAFFSGSNPFLRDAFLREGLQYYTVSKKVIGATSPFKPDVLDHFFSSFGEAHTFDFRNRLADVEAPTLIIGGDKDPVMPPASLVATAQSFRPGVSALQILENCGHGPMRDRPEIAFPILRDFIVSRGEPEGTL